MKKELMLSLAGTAALLVTGAGYLIAQEQDHGNVLPLNGYFLTEPWWQGTHGDAIFQSASGATIPLFSYSITSTKDNTTRTGTMVGTSPFASPLTGSTVPVVIVPIKITIGSSVFDPTAANTCDGSTSTITRFTKSPLIANAPLTINGASVGTTQFINGFRRAEFWSKVSSSSAYQNTLSPVTTAATVSVSAGSNGITYASGCSLLGIISYSWISNYLSNTLIPSLTKSGVIGPTKFAIFLVKNVVQSTTTPPTVSNCCILGYHSAQGSPVQTYGIMDWESTGLFGSGVADASVSAHEIGEWMDDPLGTNPTPNWGNIGQVSGCQNNLEVGDPLSGTLMPAITLNGKAYHMQELGFFSWYFNKNGVASLGSGGKFSSNGTFKGPSKACPPGGTN